MQLLTYDKFSLEINLKFRFELTICVLCFRSSWFSFFHKDAFLDHFYLITMLSPLNMNFNTFLKLFRFKDLPFQLIDYVRQVATHLQVCPYIITCCIHFNKYIQYFQFFFLLIYLHDIILGRYNKYYLEQFLYLSQATAI